eukprot:1448423-Pyramimonas_sp.AAC.1
MTQKEWDRLPIFNDVRMGDFIIVKNLGSINCYRYGNHYPKGYYSTKVRMNKGHIYGPIIDFGVFEKFFAVQLPILNYGLRWVNMVWRKKCLPLKGVIFALPVRADIGPVHLNIALQGPSSCSYQINDFKHAGALPYLGMPSIYKPRIPRTPTRRPAPRTPDPDELVATPGEGPTADARDPSMAQINSPML